MDPSILLKKCNVCNKDIEEPKHRMHEATCARNSFKCAKCGEFLSKSEKDSHESEVHTMVKYIIH